MERAFAVARLAWQWRIQLEAAAHMSRLPPGRGHIAPIIDAI